MSDDEKFLQTLADAARATEGRHEAELARIAATEEGRRASEPLDDAARSRIYAALSAQVAKPAHVTPLRAGRARIFALGAGLAMAAAVAFWLSKPDAAPLPEYALHVTSNASPTRSGPADDTAESITADAKGSFELLFRPDQEVAGSVVARAFVVENGEAREWKVPIAISADGVVRIEGATAALFERTSEPVDVIVVAARPGALPDAKSVVAELVEPKGSRHAARVHVRFTP